MHLNVDSSLRRRLSMIVVSSIVSPIQLLVNKALVMKLYKVLLVVSKKRINLRGVIRFYCSHKTQLSVLFLYEISMLLDQTVQIYLQIGISFLA